MHGQDCKGDSEKETRGESYQEKPAAQWKEIFQSVRHDFSRSYLPNAIIALICLLVGPAVGVAMKSPKIIVVSAVIGLTLALWFAGYFIYKRIPEAAAPEQPRNLPSASPLPSPPLSLEAPKGTPSPEGTQTQPSPVSMGTKVPGQRPDDKKPLVHRDEAPSHTTQRPYYADLTQPQWTDYIEDYFAGAIWRWEYRPEMGDQVPRNIHGYCPEDDFVLRDSKGQTFNDGTHYVTFSCRNYSHQSFRLPSSGSDPYEGVRKLIQEKLQSGNWQETVERQRQLRSRHT